MKMRRGPMQWKHVVRGLAAFSLGAVCLVMGLANSTALAAPAGVVADSATPLTITGTCTWGGTESTWSAKLTEKETQTYDAVYISSWGGNTLNYVGTIKTDRKTTITGSGKASGGGANGTFEFSGKYGTNGIAHCTYKEDGGGRNGSMTAETPKFTMETNLVEIGVATDR